MRDEQARMRIIESRHLGDAHQLANPLETLAIVAHALRPKYEIGPVERREHRLRVGDAQYPEDLGACAPRRAARERDGYRIAEQVAKAIEATVHRPELIAPLDDAVSLIDGQERHRASGAGQRPHQGREALGGT